jgi:hypothetical protein
MQKSQPEMPVDPVLAVARFQEAVDYCRKLQAAGRIFSGVDFCLNENGIIDVRARKPKEVLFGDPPRLFRLEDATNTVLTHLQQVRHALSASFDLESRRWNAMPIGKILANMEQGLRNQHYASEDYVRDGSGVYNVRTMHFLFGEVIKLLFLIVDESFRKRWRSGKLRLLNQYAVDFNERQEEHKLLLTLHMNAQLILCLGERRDLYGDKGIEHLITTIGTTQMLEHLKRQFGEV